MCVLLLLLQMLVQWDDPQEQPEVIQHPLYEQRSDNDLSWPYHSPLVVNIILPL